MLHADFAGRKVRFIGDCIPQSLVEGTAQRPRCTRDDQQHDPVRRGMRSSFDLALSKLISNGTDVLENSGAWPLVFEYGPMNVTRLGIKGELVRCCASRGVVAAEREQARCSGKETAIGLIAYAGGNEATRTLFGKSRNVRD